MYVSALLVSIHLCCVAIYAHTKATPYNLTAHPDHTLVTQINYSSTYKTETGNVSSGSGIFDLVECQDKECNTGFGSNAESEGASYSRSRSPFLSEPELGECGDGNCRLPRQSGDEVTEVSEYVKYGCGGMVQWKCDYYASGEVSECYSLTRCDTSTYSGMYLACDGIPRRCVILHRANLTALYYRCNYSRSSVKCSLQPALKIGNVYRLCTRKYRPQYLSWDCLVVPSASEYCTETQPSTNRPTHTTVPPIVYITGLLLTHFIVLVLAWKAEATVTNCLLKLLAVWDSLYLVFQLAEWAVWMQTWIVSSVIKDVGYVWADTGCYLQYWGSIQYDEFCSIRNTWKNADNNNSENFLAYLNHMYYIAMYFLHTVARLFQLMSIYQTVIIACFRFVAIQFPFQADRYLTYTTGWLATLGCLVVACLLHVPSVIGGVALHTTTECRYKFYVTEEYTYDQYVQCRKNLNNDNPLYLSSQSFRAFFHYFHVIFYHIIMSFSLPFTVLLVLNILMIRELWKGTQTQENIAVTRVVVAIVSVFLLSYIIKPFYIIDIYYFNGSLIDSMAHSSCGAYFSMSVLIIVLPCINSSINFLIYVGLRQSFRRQFISMFDCCRRKCSSPYDKQMVREEIQLQHRP